MPLRHFHDAAEITFCPAKATMRELSHHGFHDHLRVGSRGVEAEHFHARHRREAVRKALAPNAQFVLIYAGCIAPEKRIHLLFEAWPLVRDGTDRRAALVLVADGPALDSVRSREGTSGELSVPTRA